MDILKNLDLLSVGVVIAGIGVLGFTVLLSFLRDPSKEELKSSNIPNWQTKIYVDGYMRIYEG
ncbi:MAG TPA: hypothetical protein VJB69_00590 [Candidatus Paceibacterota bacterium]